MRRPDYWWKDIDISLNTQQNGDINDFIDEEAVLGSLSNIFQTLQGSRRMLPSFAMNLHRLLFDPVDQRTAREIGNIIVDAISVWENRAVLQKVKVIPNGSENKYNITVNFSLKNVKEEEVYTYRDILRAA